jgi:hypothetical protein
MGYPIEPLLWDDEKFVGRSRLGKLLWLYLLTGRCRSRLPGLIATEVFIVARRLREPQAEVELEMSRLIEDGMVELDEPLQLIRVKNAPRYAGICPNPNILRSWYRIWKELPKSRLKYEHLGILHQHCVAGAHEQVRAEWGRSFQKDWDTWNGSLNGLVNGSGNGLPNGLNGSGNGSLNGLGNRSSDLDQDQEQDQDLDPTVSETVSVTVPETVSARPQRSHTHTKSSSISQRIPAAPASPGRVATIAELRRNRNSSQVEKKG